MRTLQSLLGILGVFLILFPNAQGLAAQSPACTLDPRALATLEKIQGNENSLLTELQTRKILLGNILDCLQTEVDRERQALQQTKVSDPSMQTLQNNHFIALDGAAQFYTAQKTRVADAGLHSVKEIAATTREWRTNTLLPELDRIHSFTTWAHNADFLATAKDRLEELQKSAKLLQLVGQSTDIQNSLDEATDDYNTAQSFETQAQTAILNGTDPSNFLKLSLESLAKTYSAFLDLGNTITTLLPTNKTAK